WTSSSRTGRSSPTARSCDSATRAESEPPARCRPGLQLSPVAGYCRGMSTASAVIADRDTQPDHEPATVRLARACRELRRGAATGVLVEQLFGRPGEPDYIEPGHLDVLDLL